MRNYDTTNHRPYPRVTAISIQYSAAGVPLIEYIEQMAVVDGTGTVQHIDVPSSRHILDLAAITEPVQMVYPATGKAIPGKSVTSEDLQLGILAFLRADQKRRDGPAESAESAE